jgi:hypothetical protein
MIVADHCDLTVHDGRTSIRLRGPDDLDVICPIDAPQAAAIVSRLARTLATYLTPPADRTNDSLTHPDNDLLREIHDPEAA